MAQVRSAPHSGGGGGGGGHSGAWGGRHECWQVVVGTTGALGRRVHPPRFWEELPQIHELHGCDSANQPGWDMHLFRYTGECH